MRLRLTLVKSNTLSQLSHCATCKSARNWCKEMSGFLAQIFLFTMHVSPSILRIAQHMETYLFYAQSVSKKMFILFRRKRWLHLLFSAIQKHSFKAARSTTDAMINLHPMYTWCHMQLVYSCHSIRKLPTVLSELEVVLGEESHFLMMNNIQFHMTKYIQDWFETTHHIIILTLILFGKGKVSSHVWKSDNLLTDLYPSGPRTSNHWEPRRINYAFHNVLHFMIPVWVVIVHDAFVYDSKSDEICDDSDAGTICLRHTMLKFC